jgi:hypothetical protein
MADDGSSWFRYQTPDEAAYGRVTHPERYRPFRDWARDEVDRLAREYDVERVDGGAEVDPELFRLTRATDAVRLTPRSGGGAPATVVYTDFPGVGARFGRWGEVVLPWCGCDACDESPDDLRRTLEECLSAVTAGALREHLGPGAEASPRAYFGTTEVGSLAAVAPADRAAAPVDVRWGAWKGRAG